MKRGENGKKRGEKAQKKRLPTVKVSNRKCLKKVTISIQVQCFQRQVSQSSLLSDYSF